MSDRRRERGLPPPPPNRQVDPVVAPATPVRVGTSSARKAQRKSMSTEAKKLQERLNAIALERLGDTEKEDGAKSKGNSKSNSSSKSKDKSSKDKARRDKSPSKERRDKDKPSSKDREKDRDKDKDKKKRDKKRREEDDTRPLSEKISSTFARVGAGISQKLSSVPEDKKPPQKVPPSTALAGPGYSPSSLEEGRASYDGGGGT